MAQIGRTMGILSIFALTLGCAPQAPTATAVGETSPQQPAATAGYTVQQHDGRRRDRISNRAEQRGDWRRDRRGDRRGDRRHDRRGDRRDDSRFERRGDRFDRRDRTRFDRRSDRRFDRRHRPSWWGRRTWRGHGYRPSWWGGARYAANRYLRLGSYYYPYFIYSGNYYPDYSSPFLYSGGVLSPHYAAQPLAVPGQTYLLPQQATVVQVAPQDDPYTYWNEEDLY